MFIPNVEDSVKVTDLCRGQCTRQISGRFDWSSVWAYTTLVLLKCCDSEMNLHFNSDDSGSSS